MEGEIRLVTELIPFGERSTKQMYQQPANRSSAHVEEVNVTYLALVETRIRVPPAPFNQKSPMKANQARFIPNKNKYTREVDDIAEGIMANDRRNNPPPSNRPPPVAFTQKSPMKANQARFIPDKNKYTREVDDLAEGIMANDRMEHPLLAKIAELTKRAEESLSRIDTSPGGTQHPLVAKLAELHAKAESYLSRGGTPNRSRGGAMSRWGNDRLDNLGYDDGAPYTPRPGPYNIVDEDAGPFYPKSNYNRPLTPSPVRIGESERDRKMRQWIDHPRKLFRRYLEKREILRRVAEQEAEEKAQQKKYRKMYPTRKPTKEERREAQDKKDEELARANARVKSLKKQIKHVKRTFK